MLSGAKMVVPSARHTGVAMALRMCSAMRTASSGARRALTSGDEHGVARRVAIAVVDTLEVVAVEIEHGGILIARRRSTHGEIERFSEGGAVEQACQAVMAGAVRQRTVLVLKLVLPGLE